MKTPRLIFVQPPAHGSVLIFVVVLLSVLALLSATTLFIVRQGVQVSQNAAQSVESKLAADSGLRHATKALRDAITTHSIYSPEGAFFFDPVNNGAHPWLKKTDPLAIPNPAIPNYMSPLRMFADDSAPVEDESVPLSLLDEEVITSTQRYPELRFTSSPIFSQIRDQYEYALVNRIVGETATFYKGTDAAFSKDKFKAKPMTRISGMRGKYFIWIKDLDAKLYARSKEWREDPAGIYAKINRDYVGWGLDTYRTIDPTDLSIAGATPDEQQYNWEDQIRGNILKYDYESLRLISEDTLADELRDLYVQTLPNFDSRYPHFHSNKEMATQLTELYDSTDPMDIYIANPDFYSQYHAELEHYFSVYKDTPNYNSALLQKSVKQHPTALNINTASVEVIAAALSQIPAEDVNDYSVLDMTLATRPSDPAVAGSESLANTLAKRIVAKRPFLCRMDFEDFLAAHIRGAYDDTAHDVDPTYETQDTDLTQPPESDFASLTGNLPVVRMIYYALNRRWGPGYTPAGNTSTGVPINPYAADDTAVYSVKTELSLAQYLEIPGVPDNAPQYAANLPATAFPNYPNYQRARFEFFFNNTQGSGVIPERRTALITPREFNNICNSINGATLTDDLQNQPIGTVTALPVILPGSNGTLETAPQGDDTFIKRIYPGVNTVLDTARVGDDIVDAGTIIPGPNGTFESAITGDDEMKTDTSAIWPGPNGIADTWIATNRPSYYCYIDDVQFAQQFWEGSVESIETALRANMTAPTPAFLAATHILDPNVKSLLVTPTETIEQADRRAANQMRLYYRLPLDGAGSTTLPPGPPPGRPPLPEDARLDHLVSWRCQPSGNSTRRAGLYQMAFDDWTYFNGTAFGLMQPLGDGFWYADGVEDYDDCRYSVARPWSGRIVPGVTFDIEQDGAIDPGIDDNVGNGDVSWSPKFAFRSRFFNIFVLGQGTAGPGSDTTTLADEELKLRVQGEKRIEAVYDALLDQVIWQRAPVTDKRAMGEPVPPAP